MAALIMGQPEDEAIARVRKLASAHPVDMRTLAGRLQTPDGKRAHMQAMEKQTVDLPVDYLVTYSIEIGHPGGRTARHMSVSRPTAAEGMGPHPTAVWMIARAFGFEGDSVQSCDGIWLEDLKQGRAINLVQLIPHAASLETAGRQVS